MTPDDALAQLARMTAANVDPVLAPADLASLVATSQRADRYRRWPTDPEWDPTYDLNMGAAEGWRWKAAQCFGYIATTVEGGAGFNSQQVFDHCMQMAEMFARRVSVDLFSTEALWDDQLPYITGDLLP